MSRQATGTGGQPQTNIRFTAANREGVESYAMRVGISVNAAVNQMISHFLAGEAEKFAATVGTAGRGERA